LMWCVMNDDQREKLLKALSKVSELVENKPWWQKGMLDEYDKSTCKVPRPVTFNDELY